MFNVDFMCAVSFPHYFLLATGHLAEQLKTREWIVARITSITERVVDQKVKIKMRSSSPASCYFHRIRLVIHMAWATVSSTTCWRSRTGRNPAKSTSEGPIYERSRPCRIQKVSASRPWPPRSDHRFLRGHLKPRSKTRSARRNHLIRICFLRAREQTRHHPPDPRRSHDCSPKRPPNHPKSRRQ